MTSASPRLRVCCWLLASVLCAATTLLATAANVANAADAPAAAKPPAPPTQRGQLHAGAAKVDITDRNAGPVNDPLYARALVLDDGRTQAVLITVDAVAIGGIGHIKNDYLANVRAAVSRDLPINPAHIMANASHCHGVVCADVEQRTVEAVKTAWANRVPVRVGAGRGHEDRIQENRRLKLKNGKDADVRHAYALPPDEDVVDIGPVDPDIGILRLDRFTGENVAVVYTFACHPIMGVPSKGNTADITGFSSQVLEDNLSDGAVALFVQGCGGDINPVFYKDVDHPRSAEPLGHMLGLSTLKAHKSIKTDGRQELKVVYDTLELPRRFDGPERLEAMQAEQQRLLQSLTGTSLNLKTFLPLAVKYKLNDEFPSYYSHLYLREKALGKEDLAKLDAENRANMKAYIRNIYVMEQLTRLQTNMALVKRHQATNDAAGKRTVDVELVGLRVGDFVLTTFPGELTVRIGLNLKKASPHPMTFVAGYTNGYIFYAPTEDQIRSGEAQEDCDCLLAPEWQKIYEERALELLKKL